MPLRLTDKKDIVTEVAQIAKQATSVVAADYSGLVAGQITSLRQLARGAGVRMRVVRNTLARRAFEGTQFACMNSALVGPLILAFSDEDPGAAARLLRDFAKKVEKLEVKALSIDGVLLPASDLDRLANLPTREQAISMLMSVMQAPMTQFVRTLVEPHSKLVRIFAALRDQKEKAAS